MAATACALAFLPAFGTVSSLPVLVVLAAAALWLLGSALPLLRAPLPPAAFRRAFWCINLFALVLILAVSADPFLPGRPIQVSALAQRAPALP